MIVSPSWCAPSTQPASTLWLVHVAPAEGALGDTPQHLLYLPCQMEKAPLDYQGCLQRFSASNGSGCFYLLPPGFVCVSVVFSEFHCLHLNLSHWSLVVFLWFPLFYLDGFIIQSFYLILDNE